MDMASWVDLRLIVFFFLKRRCQLAMATVVFVIRLLSCNGQRFVIESVSSCPLNLSVLNTYPYVAQQATLQGNQKAQCAGIHGGLNLLVAVYVQKTGNFLLPPDAAASCIQSLDTQLKSEGSNISMTSVCGIGSAVLEQGSTLCPNFDNVSDFIRTIPAGLLGNVNSSCAIGLDSSASCSGCTAAVAKSVIYNTSAPCLDYPNIYAAGVANKAGPLDQNTVSCLFFASFLDSNEHLPTYAIVLVAVTGGLLLCSLLAILVYFLRRKLATEKRRAFIARSLANSSGPSIRPNASLVRFEMDEIKEATKNFSRFNIIGTGGFGNVYKGILKDGTEIAVKRFKNCSPSGDPEFVHEVEMISSVRHKNLLPLVGWCVGSSPLEGHQRIIVFEYMPNGSLQDHISGKFRSTLDLPTRQKIAIGTARGIAYLHNGAQPAIIHRDIKPSNILLDAKFHARVSDFGLARFAPEGVTHMTTGVAGTRGYVAPEYFMYRQLTDKSDVYSFGIVLLELLTGRSTLVSAPAEYAQPVPLSDWVNLMLKAGKLTEILDQSIQISGVEEVVERYIIVGLLCSHTQVSCRPSMAQALKMLEEDISLPVPPDRPIPLTLEASEIEQLASSSSNVSSKGHDKPLSPDGG
ncbi:hypothetical protein O6H91_23G051600 [Diphasiastrum complanatum]|uniref:Uncharacterized protein n=1 Tax=Diphasiastrum complanatum TaxID=34168 RepID=A0ACC2AAM9_DIPCM|nr:hypothetical protein O6H91_Y218500 [Diphasiastrum complanatum]KAJ7514600.1 hypothetical protein O6H91_23G051600 [Diphasiastrum complanatum]